MKKSKILFLSLASLLFLILTIGLTYYFINSTRIKNGTLINVLAVINYGSLKQDNLEEHNVTIEEGSTALQVFSKVADLELVNFSFGVYIKAVNGYEENSPYYWSFYYYNSQNKQWIYSEVGVNNYFVKQSDIIKLQYTG